MYRRDTRVRFMLGGVEQVGQGVADAVPRPRPSLPDRVPDISCSLAVPASHFSHRPVRCTTLAVRRSLVFPSGNAFSRRTLLAKLNLATVRISSDEARERTPAMERAVNVAGRLR